MSFRARLALVVAAAVALVVVAVSPVMYAIVRSELRGQVDDAVRARAASILAERHFGIAQSPFSGKTVLKLPPDQFAGGGLNSYVQLYQSGTGSTIRPEYPDVALPVDEQVRAVAAGKRDSYTTDAHVQGAHVRMFVRHVTDEEGRGYALQVIRPVGEVDSALGRIRNLLLILDAVGILVAAGLGLLVARTALGPVRRLTHAAEHVSETRDLTSRIDVEGRDELSRLATTFNTMLGTLEDSARAQQQLVTDASHELRTPLTSLRTNMELLLRHEDLEETRRRQLLRHIIEQLDELTALVAELVELGRGEQPPAAPEDVRLDLLVDEVVARAQRDHPNVRYVTSLEETSVHGVPIRIERAVSNLLDNAAKWSPPEGTIEVSVRDGEVVVRDHGPGIANEDLPYVFDRFYRAPAARGMPGSGLGLAIVKQVAEEHHGDVDAEQPAGGGTIVRLRLAAATP